MGQTDIIDILWPLGGLSRRLGFQNPQEGVYTTPDCLNVRSIECLQERLRGGSRPGTVQVLPPKTFEVGDEPASPEITVEILATKDTYILSTAATTNFDALNLKAATLTTTSYYRTLMHFDVSVIPSGSTIVSSYLRLFCTQPIAGNSPGQLDRLTQTAWVENQATWNVYSTGNSWTVAGAASDTSTPQVTFTFPTVASDTSNFWTITGMEAMVQDALDNRSGALHFLMKQTTESGNDNLTFRDSEYAGTSGEQPRLFVTYTEP